MEELNDPLSALPALLSAAYEMYNSHSVNNSDVPAEGSKPFQNIKLRPVLNLFKVSTCENM